MISFGCWNIRGLNRPLKQKEVRQVVSDNKLSLCAILESHVDVSSLFKVCKGVFSNWDWTSNAVKCDKGTRIILGWDPTTFEVMVIDQTDQVMHVQAMFKSDMGRMLCSIVYADKYYIHRRVLWGNLIMHKVFVKDKPWVVMGDCNCALFLEDSSMGSSSTNVGMRDFKACVEKCKIMDVNRTGLHYTWTQKPKKGVGILKKIDRVMSNVEFMATHPNTTTVFQPYRISDHAPCILKFAAMRRVKPKAFKFAKF